MKIDRCSRDVGWTLDCNGVWVMLQIGEFEINICTCKLTSSDSLPSFKPYVADGGDPGTGANFFSKETEHHIKGDSSKPVEARAFVCVVQRAIV